MSTEENKAVVRRFIEEVFNKGNMAVADEVLTSNYVYHSNMMGDIKGPEGFKQFGTTIRTIFPDLHVTINDMVAEGEMVAYYFTLTGTFKGEFRGIAPTGRQINIPEAHFVRFEGGKEVEETPFWDSLQPPGPERDAFFKALAEKEVPLGRMGKPEDIAGPTLFLASGLSDYVTGQVIYAAGGQPLLSHAATFLSAPRE